MVIGRDPRCNVVLDPLLYRAVSRRHAEVSPILGFDSSNGSQFWQICDLGSANGTFVNGQRIKGCQVLKVGDHIVLGQDGPEFIFEFQVAIDPSPRQSPQSTVPRKSISTQPAPIPPPSKKLAPTQPPPRPISQPSTPSTSQKTLICPQFPKTTRCGQPRPPPADCRGPKQNRLA